MSSNILYLQELHTKHAQAITFTSKYNIFSIHGFHDIMTLTRKIMNSYQTQHHISKNVETMTLKIIILNNVINVSNIHA